MDLEYLQTCAKNDIPTKNVKDNKESFVDFFALRCGKLSEKKKFLACKCVTKRIEAA